LGISRIDLFSSASVGVYSLTTDKALIIPPQIPQNKIEKMEQQLKVRTLCTTIGDSVLLGVLSCGNSKGMILPHFTGQDEVRTIKTAIDCNVAVMETEETAYGNLILTNDYGAIIDPSIDKKHIEVIQDTLGVETVSLSIAGLPYVGSLATITNKGALVHPMIREKEYEIMTDILKVHVSVGTINSGIPYIATGLIGNTNGVVAGSVTTGPELVMIGQAFDVVDKDE
jgi:translation initiation factor 6